MPRIRPRTVLYRNYDQEFEKLLARKSSERKISVSLLLADTAFGFALTVTDEDDNSVTLSFPHQKEPARTPQADNLRTQLSKLGNTPFEAGILADNRSPETNSAIEIRFSDNWFLPVSVVADWRRQAVDKLVTVRRINYRQEVAVWKPTTHVFPLPGTSSKTTASATSLTYLGNVMNTRAASFYTDHGIATVAPAYEKQSVPGAVLMFCKHCLRYSMGWCPTYQKDVHLIGSLIICKELMVSASAWSLIVRIVR